MSKILTDDRCPELESKWLKVIGKMPYDLVKLQRGMLLAMLKAFWPYALGGLLVGSAFITFLVWMIVQLVS